MFSNANDYLRISKIIVISINTWIEKDSSNYKVLEDTKFTKRKSQFLETKFQLEIRVYTNFCLVILEHVQNSMIQALNTMHVLGELGHFKIVKDL